MQFAIFWSNILLYNNWFCRYEILQKIFRGKSFVENLTKELCGKSFVEKMLKMSILKIHLKEKIKSSLQQRFSPIAGLALAILSSWKIIWWKQFYLSKKIRSFVLVSVCSSNWCKPRHVSKYFKLQRT